MACNGVRISWLKVLQVYLLFKSQFAEIGREGVLVFLSCCFVFHELNFHGVIRTVRGGLFSWDTRQDWQTMVQIGILILLKLNWVDRSTKLTLLVFSIFLTTWKSNRCIDSTKRARLTKWCKLASSLCSNSAENSGPICCNKHSVSFSIFITTFEIKH